MVRRSLALHFLLTAAALGQAPLTSVISSDEALAKIQATNILTVNGQPFHAEMQIGPEKGTNQAFRGTITLFWATKDRYRLVIDTPKFGQTLIEDHGRVFEKDRGDFYPDWVHAFVLALMDPLPRVDELRGLPNRVDASSDTSYTCISHDDRKNGILDELSYVKVCIGGRDSHPEFVTDLAWTMQFFAFEPFGTKQVARSYLSAFHQEIPLRGLLTVLEPWSPQAEMVKVEQPTPTAERIHTTNVSTATEESLLQAAPTVVTWPSVREGKLDGYMIVHALTDQSGQVREASKYNSDNSALQDFGRELALKYKFRPLIVDGIPQQMEMPLVLHFTTRIENPIPELDDVASRKIMSGCEVPKSISDPASAGQQIVIQIQVSEDGHIMTLGSSDRKIRVPDLYMQFRGCKFGIYKQQDGAGTAYHINLAMMAK